MKALIYVLMGLMLAMSSLAQPAPSPVMGYVEFNGQPAGSVEVVVTNVDTGEVLTVAEVESLRTEASGPAKGKFSYDLGQFKEGYSVGSRWSPAHTIEIKVCEIVAECVQTYNIIDTAVKRLEFKINDPGLPTEPEPEVIIKKETVEVVKEVVVEVTVVVCSDGSEVENVADCPVDGVSDLVWKGIVALAGIVLGALGVQWHRGILGLANYYWNRGQSGDKVRAVKMLFTVIKRAKEDYYTKKK